MVWLLRHRQTKGPATDRPHLTHRATSRLHTLGFWHYQGSLMVSRREAANREAKNQKA